MHRFFLPPGETRGDELLLQGPEAHHALRVLRIEKGEEVTVLNGAGEALRCRVRDTFRHELALVVEERRATPPVSHPVTLLQGVPKGKGMDAIVQKATELGVSRIVPLLSTNAVVHLDAAEARDKVEKWRRTALESIKQCGLVWLPDIEMPQSPRAFLEHGESHDLSLMAALADAGRHPRYYFREYAAAHRALPRSVAIWIGPEGDFSPAEVEAVRAVGGKVISLGPWVLRSETAAICAVAVVQYELQAGDD